MIMVSQTSIYCLDSFALLSFLLGQTAAQRVREVLTVAQQDEKTLVWMCEVNLAEVSYQLIRRFGYDRWVAQLHLVAQLPIRFVAGDRLLSQAAAQLKATNAISLADAYCAALAQRENAVVLTGDPEFKSLQAQLQIEWLQR